MQHWIELSFPTNSYGEPTFLLPVGNFGLLAMKESSRTNLDPNTVFCTLRCRQLQNTTSLLAPLVNLQAASLILLNGIPPPFPYLKLNTDGSALGNPGPAGAGGVLRDHRGQWISGFSLHGGFATNNMAELAAVRQGLEMAWNMGYKLLHLELDSKVVFSWLTNYNVNYPTNMLPLICDCRNLLH